MPRPIVRFVKDPDARLDYQIDWSLWLAEDDEIAAHDIVEVDGVEVDASSHDANTVTLVVSGGEAGVAAQATCRVTTAAGWVDDRTVAWRIRQR